MEKQSIRFGIIGLGLMGREFASAVARWCHLLDDAPVPVIQGICSPTEGKWGWYLDHFPSIQIHTKDYHELLNSQDIDAVYCAVPHHLHEKIYVDVLKAGKHLLGEKPFGIDLRANENILKEVARSENLVVRCNGELVYFPGALMLLDWIRWGRYGRLMEVKAGFHHSSDMDLNKPINWKRMVEYNGEYGCMGDLGFHIHLLPFRLGWKPFEVYADLQNIATERMDGTGKWVPCKTWDNAVLTCHATDPSTGKDFSLVFETKRMAPGATNTWFLEVYGTEGSARFTTHDPKAFYFLENNQGVQGWTRVDTGSKSAIPSITGGIFEFGFSDAVLQMLGAFMNEFKHDPSGHVLRLGDPEETRWSHQLMTAALESHQTGRKVPIGYLNSRI
jgi:predicted dehydrogenase